MKQYLLHKIGADKATEALLFKSFKTFKWFSRKGRNRLIQFQQARFLIRSIGGREA